MSGSKKGTFKNLQKTEKVENFKLFFVFKKFGKVGIPSIQA